MGYGPDHGFYQNGGERLGWMHAVMPATHRAFGEGTEGSNQQAGVAPWVFGQPARGTCGDVPRVRCRDPKLLNNKFAKTKMCSFHQEGTCQRGEGCTFAHDYAELRSSLSKT